MALDGSSKQEKGNRPKEYHHNSVPVSKHHHRGTCTVGERKGKEMQSVNKFSSITIAKWFVKGNLFILLRNTSTFH